MRRFELVAGTSKKFWEIEQAGSSVTVRFGRIGTAGTTQAKAHASPAAAKAAGDKLVAEKVAKGYQEMRPAKAAATSDQANAAGTLVDRVDAWMRAHRPKFAADKGATTAAIAKLQQHVGKPLPATLAALLAWRGRSTERFSGNYSLMSVEDILETRTTLGELLDAGDFEQPAWWNKAWVPFLENGGGDYVCVDLESAFGGVAGQVLEFWHADSDRNIIAPSIDAWLELVVTLLERGAYTLEAGGMFEPDAKTLAAVRNAICRGYPKSHSADEAGERKKRTTGKQAKGATAVAAAMTAEVAKRLCPLWWTKQRADKPAPVIKKTPGGGFYASVVRREFELDPTSKSLLVSWDIGIASTRSIEEFRDAVFDEMFAQENEKLAAKYPHTALEVRQTRPRLAEKDRRLAYVMVRRFGDPAITDDAFDKAITDVGKSYFGEWSMKFGWAVNAERERRKKR